MVVIGRRNRFIGKNEKTYKKKTAAVKIREISRSGSPGWALRPTGGQYGGSIKGLCGGRPKAGESLGRFQWIFSASNRETGAGRAKIHIKRGSKKMQLEDLEVDLGGKRNTATLSRYNRIPDAIAGKKPCALARF